MKKHSSLFLHTVFSLLLFAACGPSPETLLENARKAMDEGDPKKAIRLANEALKAKPEFAAAQNLKGAAFFAQEDYKNAEVCLSKAIELDSTDYRPYLNRGHARRHLQRPSDALLDYDAVIAREKNLDDVYLNRALVLQLLQRDKEAEADLNRCIYLNPKSVNAYFYRARLHERVGNTDKALHDYEAVTQLDPKNGRAFFNLALLQLAADSTEIPHAHDHMPAPCELLAQAKALGHAPAEKAILDFCQEK